MIKLLALVLALFIGSTTYANESIVTAIIPYTPGGGVDTSLKNFKEYLKEKKNINLVFEYRPGAESLIGSQAISQASKDGSVIGYTNIAGLASVIKNNNLEFEYVTATRNYPTAIITNAQSSIRSFDDLLTKLNNGHVFSFGYSSAMPKIQINQILSKTKPVQQIMVPYKGSSGVLNDLLGNHIQVAPLNYSVVRDHIKANKLRILAITYPVDEISGITVLNKKYTDWTDSNGYCVILPKGTSAQAVEYWQKIFNEYLNDPETLQDFYKENSDPLPIGPVALKKLVAAIIKIMD
jgi:tripartite-type tricarboxylate transporter receptor subunit TctC